MSESENSMEMRRASMPSLKLEYMTPQGRQQLVDLHQAIEDESPESRNI